MVPSMGHKRMNHNLFRAAAALAIALVVPGSLSAQSFNLGSRKVQLHGFFSQGFAKSNQNNYLTMGTDEGSAAMTDGGMNVSTNLTERLRVGAQVYSRNIGKLGNGRVELDWAFADYRFTDWFGVRAGKVKSALGLFNDTQDSEFLHTWALLPQSLYPLDMRANTIAHVGADAYGEVSLKRLGSLSYTAYIGKTPDDPEAGFQYSLADSGLPLTTPLSTRTLGADVRWNTPMTGLILGTSVMKSPMDAQGVMKRPPFPAMAFDISFDRYDTFAFYGDYTFRNLRINGEYRKSLAEVTFQRIPNPPTFIDFRGWFASAAYRFHRRLEVGTYHSRYYPNMRTPYRGGPADHLFDQTVTVRVDLNRYWNVKLEGHLLDGYGNVQYARGFYASSHPNGIKPTMTLFVLRTGVNF